MNVSLRLVRFVLSVVVPLSFTCIAQAQPKAGDLDIYGSVGWQGGMSFDASNYAHLHGDMDGAWMWGFGTGYHFSDKLSMLFDFSFGSSSLGLTVPSTALTGTWRQTADYFNGRLNLEYSPHPAVLEPVLSGGIGFNNFRTAVPGAPPQTWCGPSFYGYWWCATGVPTYDQTAFSWNIGGGLRWQASPSMFLKLMYTATWADFHAVKGTPQFNTLTLQIGGTMPQGF